MATYLNIAWDSVDAVMVTWETSEPDSAFVSYPGPGVPSDHRAIKRKAFEPTNDLLVSVTPSRTSGVAPLAVTFDASNSRLVGQSGSISLLEMNFSWDFDDVGAGSWSTSGESKNTSTDPVGAHVFETPGTYNVTLTITNPATGLSNSDTVTITVDDPDVVFSGANTYVFSPTGNFTGAPAGATQVTEGDFRTIVNTYAQPGRRLLLHRGETFSMSSFLSISNRLGPVYIGTYDAGAKPIIQAGADTSFFGFFNSSRNITDWRFIDLDFKNFVTATPSGLFMFTNSDGYVHQCTFLRCDFSDFNTNFSLAVSANARPEDVCIVDCTFNNPYFNGNFISAYRLIFMGNTTGITSQEHNFRCQYFPLGVFSHNVFNGTTATIRQCMKMAGLATNEDNPSGTNGETELVNYSGWFQYFAISHNTLNANNAQTPFHIGPQAGLYDERIRYGVIQNNTFNAGANVVTLVTLYGVTGVECSNNLFNMTLDTQNGISVQQRGIEPVPRDCRILNNTMDWPTTPVGVPVSIAAEAVDCVESGTTNI